MWKPVFGACLLLNICCLETYSPLSENLFGCQRPQWVQYNTYSGVVLMRWCLSIVRLVSKTLYPNQCSNIVWKMDWNIEVVYSACVGLYQNIFGCWNIFSLCCVKMLISKHFGTKSIEIFSAYLWIISKHLGLGHWNILSPIPSETKHLGLSQPVLCENAYIRTCGIKKLWNIPSQ